MQAASLTNSTATLLPQSIMRTLATAEAGLVYELYAYLDYIAKMAIPATAEGEYLEAWANLKAVYRVPPAYAMGAVIFTGTTGTAVPIGTLLTNSTGQQYSLLNAYVVGVNGPVGSFFIATQAGTASNAAAGTALSLVTPINGVNSLTAALTSITGGTDQETDASFRARMLAVYAAPPDGGSSAQFVEWALAVPGVTRAWVNPQGLGPGSVTIWVMFDLTEIKNQGFPQGSNGGATSETRIAAATGDQLAVANALYPLRPVTSLVYVAAPSAFSINFALQAVYPFTQTVQDGISAALTDLFVRLGSPLAGNIIYPSDVNAALESVAGLQHYTLLTPLQPITVPIGNLAVLGQITYS